MKNLNLRVGDRVITPCGHTGTVIISGDLGAHSVAVKFDDKEWPGHMGNCFNADGSQHFPADWKATRIDPLVAFDPTKPVRTRDGCKARILVTGLKSAKYPIGAEVFSSTGESSSIETYTAEGRYRNSLSECQLDLVNCEPEPEVTVEYRLWRDTNCSLFFGTIAHPTKEHAAKIRADTGLDLTRNISKITRHDGEVVKIEMLRDDE